MVVGMVGENICKGFLIFALCFFWRMDIRLCFVRFEDWWKIHSKASD
jgi:hypothetical protein